MLLVEGRNHITIQMTAYICLALTADDKGFKPPAGSKNSSHWLFEQIEAARWAFWLLRGDEDGGALWS